MKVLVTGCAGFIGSNLTERLLKDGYEVIGIDCFRDYYSKKIKDWNIKDSLKSEKFTLIEEDILSISKFPDVDYVFHQAAQAGVRASWGNNFSVYTRDNIEATQRLLEFYKTQTLKKFVYASSSSVYGNSEELPMKETARVQPVSPYGVTKLAAEHLCHLYYINYNVPTVSLRYFTVYGPKQRPDMGINKFFKAIANRQPITIYGDGNQTRDFTYIDDVIEANIQSARSDVLGEVFNIGGGNQISVNDLISEIEESTGKSAIIKYIDEQKGDVKDTKADTQKAKELLNWKANINIKTGLNNYKLWFDESNAIL